MVRHMQNNKIDIPDELKTVWNALSPDQCARIEELIDDKNPKEWNMFWLTMLFEVKPPEKFNVAFWRSGLGQLQKFFESKYPEFTKKAAPVVDDIPDEPDNRDETEKLIDDKCDINTRARKFTADQAKEKVDTQLEAIKKALEQRNISRALDFTAGLVGFSCENCKIEHIAMSLCNIAKTAIDIGEFEFAGKITAYAERLAIEDPVIPCTKALLHHKKNELNELNEALKIYTASVERFPNSVVALCGQAEVLKDQGELDKALEVYTASVERFPNDVVALCGQAEVLKDQGELDKALKVYTASVERFPNSVVALCGQAEVLKDQGELDKALEVYNASVERFPNSVVARNGKANLLAAMNRLYEAIATYKDVYNLQPKKDVYTLCGLGFLLMKRNKDRSDIEEALDLFSQAEKIYDKQNLALLGLWVAHSRLGNSEKALYYKNRFEIKTPIQTYSYDTMRLKDVRLKEAALNIIGTEELINKEKNPEARGLEDGITAFIRELINISRHIKVKSHYGWIVQTVFSWKIFLKTHFLNYENPQVPTQINFSETKEKITALKKEEQQLYEQEPIIDPETMKVEAQFKIAAAWAFSLFIFVSKIAAIRKKRFLISR